MPENENTNLVDFLSAFDALESSVTGEILSEAKEELSKERAAKTKSCLIQAANQYAALKEGLNKERKAFERRRHTYLAAMDDVKASVEKLGSGKIDLDEFYELFAKIELPGETMLVPRVRRIPRS